MILFFDTEFTELGPKAQLISLGIISEKGDRFYAEFTDYDDENLNKFVKENVVANLWSLPNDKRDFSHYDIDNKLMYCKGDSITIRCRLLSWLEEICDHKFEYEVHNGLIIVCSELNVEEHVQFVGDCCHYDFVLLLNQLFDGALGLPANITPTCYDICHDILNYYQDDTCGNYYSLDPFTMHDAFNASREKLCKKVSGKLPSGKKHNALYDAEVAKLIYEGFRR